MAKKKAAAKRLPHKSTWPVQSKDEQKDEFEDGQTDSTIPGQELLDALERYAAHFPVHGRL